jgi:hypothetical protein
VAVAEWVVVEDQGFIFDGRHSDMVSESTVVAVPVPVPVPDFE